MNRLVLLMAGSLLVVVGFLAAIAVTLVAGAAVSWPDDADRGASTQSHIAAVLVVAAVSLPVLVIAQRVAVALLCRALHQRSPAPRVAWRHAAILVTVAFSAVAFWVGIANAGPAPVDTAPRGSVAEQRAVLAVARAGRRAILQDHPDRVCALLTPRAQQNSLILYGLDHDYKGHKRPKATTCAQAVGYMIDDIQISGELRRAIRRPG